MTKEEAHIELEKGNILTHPYFTEYEWIKLYDKFNYQFDDGVIIGIKYFWVNRYVSGWNDNWEIYKGVLNEI